MNRRACIDELRESSWSENAWGSHPSQWRPTASEGPQTIGAGTTCRRGTERRASTPDLDRDVTAYAVFHGSHTGEGGPVPPTGKRVAADYVYRRVNRRTRVGCLRLFDSTLVAPHGPFVGRPFAHLGSPRRKCAGSHSAWSRMLASLHTV